LKIETKKDYANEEKLVDLIEHACNDKKEDLFVFNLSFVKYYSCKGKMIWLAISLQSRGK